MAVPEAPEPEDWAPGTEVTLVDPELARGPSGCWIFEVSLSLIDAFFPPAGSRSRNFCNFSFETAQRKTYTVLWRSSNQHFCLWAGAIDEKAEILHLVAAGLKLPNQRSMANRMAMRATVFLRKTSYGCVTGENRETFQRHSNRINRPKAI